MTSDELADHLVTHFNAISDPLIQAQAVKPETIAEAEREQSNFKVFVIPFGESDTRVNRGDVCDQRRTVSVAVAGPIGTITRALAIQFMDQLKRSLRLTQFDGHRWMSNETVTYWHPEALKTKSQFYSVFRAEYMGLG